MIVNETRLFPLAPILSLSTAIASPFLSHDSRSVRTFPAHPTLTHLKFFTSGEMVNKPPLPPLSPQRGLK